MSGFRQSLTLTKRTPAGIERVACGAIRHSGLQVGACGPVKKVSTNRLIGIRKKAYMLWTLAVVLLVLWLLGMVSSYTMGGVIHILLVVAIVMVLVRIIRGERPV